MTWIELARRAAIAGTADPVHVRARMAGEFGWLAPRPAYSALGSRRARFMPGLDDALARCVAEAAGHAQPVSARA